MTVSTTRVTYSYFPGAAMALEKIPFQFLTADDLLVTLGHDGVALVPGNDFVISGDGRAAQGGITTLRMFANDEMIVLRRVTAQLQQAVTSPFKPLPGEAVERELDRRAFIAQETGAEVGRSIRVRRGEAAPSFPSLDGSDGKFLRFGPNGQSLVLSDGTATQVQAYSREFVAAGGPAIFQMPFDLFVTPTVLRNGLQMPRTTYVVNGREVSILSDLVAGDEIEIKVGEAIPHPLNEIAGPFVLRDLSPGMTPVPTGIYLGQGGNALSFETLISSPSTGADTDNQRAMLLLVTETSDDGNSEEQTLCLLTTIKTGLALEWAPSTAYAVGDNVKVGAINNVYRCVHPGISAASGSGPSGKGLSINDGSCVWDWINDDAINAKVGLYNEVVAKPGGGRGWAQANNMEIEPGYSSEFLVNTELDLTNHCGIDTVFGGPNKYNLYMITDGTSRSTAALALTSRNTTNYAAFWAIHISGHKHAQNAVIGIDASSNYGIGFGVSAGGAETPTFTGATIKDGSNATSGLELAGNYAAQAISVSGNVPAAISLTGNITDWMIYTPGPFRVDKDGNLRARSLAITAFNGPASSSSAGTVGSITFDANYMYFCFAPNQWKRVALSAF